MALLKIIVQERINDNKLKALNTIVSKMKNENKVSDLWIEIQHLLEMFFDEDFNENELIATFDENENIIDFKDEDGTLIFYVKKA